MMEALAHSSLANVFPPHWRKHRERLEKACKRSGDTHDIKHVLSRIMRGQAQWWATPEAFVVTEIVAYPKRKVLRLWLCGGDLAALKAMEPQILDFARERGCTRAAMSGFRAWTKILKGYRVIGTVSEKEL